MPKQSTNRRNSKGKVVLQRPRSIFRNLNPSSLNAVGGVSLYPNKRERKSTVLSAVPVKKKKWTGKNNLKVPRLRPQTSSSSRGAMTLRQGIDNTRLPDLSSKEGISLERRPGTAPLRGNLLTTRSSLPMTRLEKIERMRINQANKERQRAEIYAMNSVLRQVFHNEFSAYMKTKSCVSANIS